MSDLHTAKQAEFERERWQRAVRNVEAWRAALEGLLGDEATNSSRPPYAPARSWAAADPIREVLEASAPMMPVGNGHMMAAIAFLAGSGTMMHTGALTGPEPDTLYLTSYNGASDLRRRYAVVRPERLYAYVPQGPDGTPAWDWSYLWMDLGLLHPLPSEIGSAHGPFHEVRGMSLPMGQGTAFDEESRRYVSREEAYRLIADNGRSEESISFVSRYLGGAFVFFSTGSPYNLLGLDSMNDRHGKRGTVHESLGRAQFAGFIAGAAKRESWGPGVPSYSVSR